MKSVFSEHLFEYRTIAKRRLLLSLIITFIVMLVEVIGGWLTNSIALISDAGHMFTHCFAIGISLVAILIASKPPCHHRTFGLYRAEVLAAFVNGLFLLMVVCLIIYEAIMRIIHPRDIVSLSMLLIGFIGLCVNIASIMILHGSHKKDLNIRGVFYHMAADAASSVGIVSAAVIIHFTGWNMLDPLVSIGISLIIVYWAWTVLREAVTILLEMAPKGLDVDMIANDLKKEFPAIEDLYNVHIWTITGDMLIFSAHVKFDDTIKQCTDHDRLINGLNQYLADKYRIIESTIQIAGKDQTKTCRIRA
jgi:cobalt-zinc-cadmium efflux system protein